jgi:hypothetical protein
MLRVIAEGILGRDVAKEFLQQHLDESPLTFRELCAGKKYDQQLRRWNAEEKNALISATTKLMVTGLVGLPVDENTAERLGRYLALISTDLRDEAWGQLQRSAPDWLNPLKETTAKWYRHLAKRGELLSSGGSTQLTPLE